jgi:hypothetical protein
MRHTYCKCCIINSLRLLALRVRNAEVGSSSLLPSTNLRSCVMRRLPTVARSAKVARFLPIPSSVGKPKLLRKKSSSDGFFFWYGVIA